MVKNAKPGWKAADRYTINKESGIAEKDNNFCTLHFYLAAPGDVLHLLDDSYEYAVATYSLDIDPKYIYTYDYQPEQNWTTYRRDFSEEKFARKDYVFAEKVYFRIVLRKHAGQKAESPAEPCRS